MLGFCLGEGIGLGLVGVRRYRLFALLLKVSHASSWAGVRQGKVQALFLVLFSTIEQSPPEQAQAV